MQAPVKHPAEKPPSREHHNQAFGSPPNVRGFGLQALLIVKASVFIPLRAFGERCLGIGHSAVSLIYFVEFSISLVSACPLFVEHVGRPP